MDIPFSKNPYFLKKFSLEIKPFFRACSKDLKLVLVIAVVAGVGYLFLFLRKKGIDLSGTAGTAKVVTAKKHLLKNIYYCKENAG